MRSFLPALVGFPAVFLAGPCSTPPPRAEPLPAEPVASELEVHFLDVGSGDCIWIRTGDDGVDGNGQFEGLNILIDGGDQPSFGRVDGYASASAYLTEDDRLPKGSTIDWLILSHPHSDHCGGLDEILDDYEVLRILDPGHDPLNEDGVPASERPTSAYGSFFTRAATERVNGVRSEFVSGIPNGFDLDWGSELQVEILHSSRTVIDHDLNNTSIVLRLGFTDPSQTVSFLFTGDAEEAVEELLVARLGDGLRTTVLKAGHHGSASSSTEAFLRAVRPAHVVISSGNQAFSGTRLPAEATLGRIEAVSADLALGTQVWRTDRGDKDPLVPVGEEAGDDTVLVRTNGTSLTVGYVSGGAAVSLLDPARCQAQTLAGKQCSRNPKDGSSFCWQHQP